MQDLIESLVSNLNSVIDELNDYEELKTRHKNGKTRIKNLTMWVKRAILMTDNNSLDLKKINEKATEKLDKYGVWLVDGKLCLFDKESNTDITQKEFDDIKQVIE